MRGLLRAARANDALLDRIRVDLSDGLLPQRDALAEVLNFGPTVEERVTEYAYEDVLALKHWDMVGVNFAAVAVQLAQLEDSLVDLRRAVTWSSRYSAYNWWTRRRQYELGVDELIVIAGPGSARQFLIEPVSSIATAFAKARTSLKLTHDELDSFGRVRILTVPQDDGAAARWHPIGLGHELAHLRFNQEWVNKWLAGREPNPHTSKAIQTAQDLLSEESRTPGAERWWHTLVSWLVETSCDAATVHFYGDAGIEALATFFAVHSTVKDGEQHPAPSMRLATLTATTTDDLASFRPEASEPLTVTERKNAYCDLALEIRNAVFDELGDDYIDPVGRTAVAAAATTSLNEGYAPQASSWDPSWVTHKPATIEAGLVAALWKTVTNNDVDKQVADETADQTTRNETRIEHAIDFLQFVHRFEVERSKSRTEMPDKGHALTNVLHVTSHGIRTDALPEPGASTHDVRLGRHFIVFRRNQIPTLNLLQSSDSRRIQDAIEVGWGEEFVLHPAEMVLAVTLESVYVSNDCTAQVLSRSSLGRMGLLSATAVQVQPGFRGCLTLELVNLASVPLRLSPGQRVAQIVPTLAVGQLATYDGKYQDQTWKPRFSAANTDWELDVLSRLRDDE